MVAVADAGYASFSLPTTGCIQNSLYITLCPWPFGFFVLLPPFVHPFHFHGIVRIGARVSVLAFFSTKQPPCTDVAPSARTLSAVLTYAWKDIRTLSAEPRHQHSLTKCPSCMGRSNSHSVNELSNGCKGTFPSTLSGIENVA